VLVFIDESGIPHPHDSSTRPVLVAMCLRERHHRRLNQALFRFKRDLLGREDPIDIKGTKFLRPRVFARQPKKRELTERRRRVAEARQSRKRNDDYEARRGQDRSPSTARSNS